MSHLPVTSKTHKTSIDPSWLALLESKGGAIAEGQRTVFPQSQQQVPGQFAVPCTQESVICCEGKDAESFLQSQVTCDIKDLGDTRFLFGAYCNPKGRVLATFRLFPMNGAIYMVTHHSNVTPLLDRLKMFVLRADVTFRVCSDLAVMYLSGDVELDRFSTSTSCQIGSAWPKECHGDSEPGPPAQLIVVPVTDAIEFIEETGENIALQGSDYWNLLQIRHGIATVTALTSGLFTPQNINLDLVSGVSFTKGCYPGQEIVARLRYLGRVKQRVLRGKINSAGEVSVGQPVYLADALNEKAGTIVNASALDGINTECLLSVSGFLEAKNVYCYRVQGNEQFTTLPLPYRLQEPR